MKKLIVLITIFSLAGVTAFAYPNSDVKTYYSKQFNHGISFNKIVVADDIDLVVYENATSNIQFDGTDENVAKVDWKIKNGVLYLKSKQGSLKNKVLVTLDVRELKEIVIEGKSNVRSLGNLNSPNLSVVMREDCFVAIRNYGAIRIIRANDIDVDVLEKEGRITIL